MLTACFHGSALDRKAARAGLFVALLVFAVPGRAATIARGGKTQYVVVESDRAAASEKFAAQELTNFLARVTGASFPVAEEAALSNDAPRIYVGWTKFAAGQGIDAAALDGEEWIIRSAGKDLVITGGRPRGTLYGVYEFLEKQAGCRWLDRDTEIVPSRPTLAVGRLDIRAKPAFWWRGFYGGFFHSKPDSDKRLKETLFRLRNKGNAEDAAVNRPQYGFQEYSGRPANSHTFYRYVDPKVWFEKHPEYFSDDGSGKRTAGAGGRPGASGSSLCVTHPEVRKIVVKQLREFIALDRAACAKGAQPPPKVYDISQEDNAAHMCRCPECRKIIDREGSESGPLVEFINHVADEIRGDYPDVFVQTFAYVSTEKPPRTLRVRDNVIIRWADLYSRSESVRPLTHPFNREQAEMLRGWGQIATNVFVWDYWGHGGIARPDVNIQTIQPDFQFFRDNNVRGLMIEAEQSIGQSFYMLGRWLMHKLMQDPDQPVEPLVEVFLDGYYGPAAPKIREWLKYVQDRIAANPDRIISSFPSQQSRRHWDLDFFVKGARVLQEAVEAAPPESPYRKQAQKELAAVLGRMTERLDALEAEAAAGGRPLPFSRKEIVDRYEAVAREAGMFSGGAMAARLDIIRNPPPLPAPLKNVPADQMRQLFWPDFLVYGNELVDDPGAAAGRALRLKRGGLPYAMGVYDKQRKTAGPRLVLKAGDVPRDEQYHLYKIGRFRVGPGVYLWAHPSWLLGAYLDSAYQLADGVDPSVNDWDIYISLKLTGSVYVEGSKQATASWMDRIILVKPGYGGTK